MTAENAALPLIRRLTVEDAAAFRAIRLEALTEAPTAFASTAADFALRSEAGLRAVLADLTLFAAFRGNEPVGLMGLMRNGSSKMAHRGTLVMVYVRACERGGALADALLDAVTGAARGSACGSWSLPSPWRTRRRSPSTTGRALPRSAASRPASCTKAARSTKS